MNIIPVVTKLVLLISIMFAGYAFARKNLISPAFIKQASWLTVNLFMCAGIFYSIMGVDKTTPAGQGILYGTLSVLIGYAIAIPAGKLFFKDDSESPVLRLLMAVNNPLFIGIPLAASLYGSLGSFYVALSCIPFNLMLYGLGVYWLVKGKSSDGSFNWKNLISVPMVTILVSILLFVLKLEMPPIVMELASTLNGATVPMSMLVVGGSLGRISLKEAFTDKKAYITAFFRIVLAPLITLPVMKAFISDPVLLGTVVVCAACPSAIAISVLAATYDYDGTLASKGILLSSVLSLITIPLILLLV